MLKGNLIHPQILEALGRAGHASRILIADGNYPAATTLSPSAKLVSLNLSPGIVTCTDVLGALLTAVPIEAAAVMAYHTTGPYALQEPPPIWAEFDRLLNQSGAQVELEAVERFEFYAQAQQPDVCLTIATADQRVYANLLLTIGVIMPPS
ncbi:MAG: RbsD/FucU family protein [Pirellulaceae bacterium]|nr:RbsD/FucU family protein [Pirellulaceae bacterium]|tara:strand:- start:25 stop:477 length:453 start_codon:yes stop_codon:yes gene_type:complete